jgi:hypothetical protein
MAKAKSTRRAMSVEHKAALAKGREEGRAVRSYLDALESSRPKRGRKRTPASIDKRLAAIDAQLDTSNSLDRLHLLQERKDLEEEKATLGEAKDVGDLEKQFVKVAKTYGARKGISYSTWRQIGVSAQVLQKAGIARTRG